MIFFTTFFLNLSKKINPLKIKSFIQIVFLMFFFGALISVIDTNSYAGFYRGLKVLPNYLYWVLICILLINIYKQIKLYSIARYLFFGIMISAIYFFLFPFLPKIPGFLNPITKNSFSFLAICFGAPSLMYILKNKGRIYFYIFSAILLFVLLSNGRRAGFIIVLASIFFSVTLKEIKIKQIIAVIFFLLVFKLILSISLTNNFIMKSSPRIHQLIYSNTSDLMTEDRSLLVRRLMVEKASIIFESNPLTGIGLNSFSSHNVDFRGDFEGSQFVINKSNSNSKSAHNSYVSLLSEGGLLLLIPFLIIIIFNIYNFLKYYNHRAQIENSFYWSFIGMCVHLYFISAIINVYAWFLIGFVSAMSVNSKKMLLEDK